MKLHEPAFFIPLYLILISSSLAAEVTEHFTVLGDELLSQSISSKTNTTTFYKEDLDKIPNAFLQDLTEFTPGMTYTGGTAKGRFFQIRGIGERSSYEGMPNYSVALVLDDIDYSGFGNVMGMSDIDQASIQRGPQLTVQGPNGIGGLITLRTKDTSPLFTAEAKAGYASFNTKNIYASTSASLSDHLSFRLSSQMYKSDGYIKNTFTSNHNTNYSNDRSVKGKLTYQTSKWDITYNFHHFNFKDGYDVFNQMNSNRTYSDHPGADNSEINAQSLKVERDFGAMLYSATLAYLKSHSGYSYDEDWGNDTYWNALPGYNKNYNYNITFPKKRERKSIDQRLYFEQGQVQSHIGLYLRKDKEETRELGFKNDAIRKDIKSKLEVEQIALYGQLGWSLTDRLEVILGSRLESRNSNYSDSQKISAHPLGLLWGAEASMIYRIKKRFKTYAKLARGFKAGGVNTQPSVEASRKEFRDEKLYLAELGFDLGLSKERYIKGAFYGMYRDDIQVKTSYQDNPSDPSSYTFYQDNASSAKIYGLEVEGRQAIMKYLSIKYGVALMHSQFGSYRYGSRNLKNRQLPYSPSYKINYSLDYQHVPSGWFANFRGSMQDSVYFGNSHDQKSKTNQLVHLNLGKSFSWGGEVRLWCKNLLNEKTELRGFYFSNEPPNWKDQRYVQLGPPRMVGMNISYTY